MTDTVHARWKRAITKARRQGVNVVTNVNVCCHSCTTHADLNMREEDIGSVPYAYFLRTQGRRVRFLKTGAVAPSTNEICYFSHGGDSGHRVAQAFRDEGFEVEWDGTETKTIGVRLREKAGAQ